MRKLNVVFLDFIAADARSVGRWTHSVRDWLLPGLVGLSLILPEPASAQFTSNNQTIIISGVVSNWTGDYFVGRTNYMDLLFVQGGAKLAVTNGDGYIGYSSVAVSNSMVVTGGATWTNPGSLFVGYGGDACQLTISDSGQVFNASAILGYESAGNAALVTGSGTTWFAGSTSVGGGGSGNRLTVSSGAKVVSDVSYLGLFSWSESNSVLVTGSGSVWSNSQYLYVGNGGAGNQLTISNGATVYAVVGGVFNDCHAVVSGSNSMWNSSSTLRVDGSNAHLDVGGGASVSSGTGYLGYYQPGGTSGVSVAGRGSVWDNAVDLYVGCAGGDYLMTIAAGGIVFNNDGYIGYQDTSAGNAVMVTDAGSVWSNRATLYVGDFGPANRLTITNGGRVYSGTGVLGSGTTANSNAVVVTGGGSVWSNASTFYIGEFGAANQYMAIENGGAVYDSQGYIGMDTASSNNSVLVTGNGSLWNNTAGLVVGAWGPGNWLVITNGAEVCSDGSIVGTGDSSSNNTVVVTGGGTVWSNRGDLAFAAYDNQVLVLDGGSVYCRDGRLGDDDAGGNNRVTVCGPGAIWNIRTNLYVSHFGVSNQLLIVDGGVVNDEIGTLGYAASSSNNTVLVAGAGSVWNNRTSLQVGLNGSGNTLIISNGATVSASSNVIVGVGTSASGNCLTVMGGALAATNASGKCRLNVYRGTFTLNGGRVDTDVLLVTNGANGVIVFNSGDLRCRDAIVDNGQAFAVGNGLEAASYSVHGGTNYFANGLLIRTNATLSGYGTVDGNVLVQGQAVVDGAMSGSSLALQGITVAADASSGLHFTGSVTNNGMLVAVNGGVLDVFGPMVNNGIIDIIDGSTNFHSTFVNNGMVVDATGDADGDGLPNGWERAHGLNVYSATGEDGTAGDPDGDGLNNMNEYCAGTDPTNAQSVLAATAIHVIFSGIRVEWKGGTDVWQYLERADNLSATGTQWRTIFTNSPPTTLATNVVDASATNRTSFYRIKTVR